MRRSRSGRFVKGGRGRSSRRRSSRRAPRVRTVIRYRKARAAARRRSGGRRRSAGSPALDFAVSVAAGTVGFVAGSNLVSRVPQLNTPGKRAAGAVALGVLAGMAASPIARVLPVVKARHVTIAALGAGIAGVLPVAGPILARSRVPLLGASGTVGRLPSRAPAMNGRAAPSVGALARLSQSR